MCPTKIETEANTKLIADTFTTINKCNLFPSELLEQRNELLEVLRNIIGAYNGNGNSVLSEIDKAKQAIAKIETI